MKIRRRTVIVLAVVSAVLAGPWSWLPAVASVAARRMLDFDSPGSASARVSHLSPFRLSADGICAPSLPGNPSIGSIELRYTPWGIISGKVKSAQIGGIHWSIPTNVIPKAATTNQLNPEVEAKLSLVFSKGLGYRGGLWGEACGIPFLVEMQSDAMLSRFTASLPLAADSSVAAIVERGDGNWTLSADMPPNRFSHSDPLPAALLTLFNPPDAPAMDFSGSLEAHFAMTNDIASFPAPIWHASLRVRDLDFETTVGEAAATLRSGGALFRAQGFGSHIDVHPFGIRFEEASFDRFNVGQGSMWFRTDLNSVLLTEGFAKFCGGTVRVYALHLNLSSLNAGFTVLLDDLDAGEVLALVPDLHGSATGTMHGKIPLSISKGSEVRLRDAYLYSPPGQIGKLKLESAPLIVDRLRETGVPGETCDSLEKALQDLDYDILRLDLVQDRKTGDGRLSIRLHGTAAASAGRAATPVDLNLSFNGQIQDFVNTGLKAAGLQAGKVGK